MKEFFLSHFSRGNIRSVTAKKHIVYSFVFKGASIIIGFLYVPLLLDYLDSERYGIWITLASILGWFEFFNIGFGNGLRNRFAEAVAKDDHRLARIYVSTTYAVLGIIFLSLLVIFLIINPLLSWNTILNTTLVPPKELTLLAGIVFSFFIFRFIFRLIGIVLIADQKPAMNEVFLPIGNIIVLAIIIILIRTTDEGSLVILGCLLSGVPVVVLVIASFILYNGKYKQYMPSFKFVQFRYVKDLMSLGIRFFIISIAGIVIFTTSNIIITQVLGPEQVTVYNIAFKYFQIPIMIYAIVMTPIWSAVTDAHVKEDYVWLKNTFKRLNRLAIISSVGIVIMLFVSDFAYKVWIGDRVEVSFLISAMMALYAIIHVMISPYNHFINGFGKLRLSTLSAVAQAILFIPIALLLVKSPMGVAGIILATCLINSISFLYQPTQNKLLINRRAHGIWNK